MSYDLLDSIEVLDSDLFDEVFKNKLFSCSICLNKRFTTNGNLNYHLRTIHNIDNRKMNKKSNESEKKVSDLDNVLKFYETIKKFGSDSNVRDSLRDHFKDVIVDVKLQAFEFKSVFQKSIDHLTTSIDDISSNESISDRVSKVLSEIDEFEIEEISSIINVLTKSVELKKLKQDSKFIAVKSFLKVLDTPRSSHDDLSTSPRSRNSHREKNEALMLSAIINSPVITSSSSAEEASSTGKRSVLGMVSDAVLGKRKTDS